MAKVPAWKKQIPNWVTFSRILVVPLIIWTLTSNCPYGGWGAALLFILGSLTDYFDGALARRYGVESTFGKFMDPIADKILVTSTLVILIPTGRLSATMVIILLARDTLIQGLRSVAATQRIIIAAGAMGKWKTAIQMFAIPCVLVHDPVYGIPVFELGYWTLWISVALSLISGAEYVWNYARNRSKSR